jgi:hypothetical protein
MQHAPSPEARPWWVHVLDILTFRALGGYLIVLEQGASSRDVLIIALGIWLLTVPDAYRGRAGLVPELGRVLSGGSQR